MRKSILFIFICGPILSFGWGNIGHRVTAEIASKYLSAEAKAEINKLAPFDTMARMSNYPDFIKSDADMRKKYNHHHYISVDKSGNVSKYIEKHPEKENIVTSILNFEKVLKNPKNSNKERLFALKFLIHLIGDIHQPLHVGHAQDRGGNKVKVTWFGTKTNLHAVWDEHLVEMQKLSYTEYAQELIKTHDIKKITLDTPVIWAQESRDYLEKTYEFKEGKYWEYGYNYKHNKVLNERLVKAGLRMAGFLNNIFKDQD